MGDYIRTEPSGVYVFNFERGRNVTQSDLTSLAGSPGGSFEEIDEPDGSGTVQNIRQPMGQQIEASATDCAMACISEVLGIEDVLTAAGVASTPFPKSWAGLPRGAGGATPLTNLPSVIAHKNPALRNARIPVRVPTPVLTNRAPFIAMRATSNVVRIFGRFLPGIGWGLLAYDVIRFTRCYNNCGSSNDASVHRQNMVPVGQVSSMRAPGDRGLIPVGQETNALDVIGDQNALFRRR